MVNNVFSKIIEALQVSLIRVNFRKVLTLVHLKGTFEQRNILIQARKGKIYAGERYEPLETGGIYYVPANQPVHIKFGDGGNYVVFDKQGFQSGQEREKYIATISTSEVDSQNADLYVIIMFDVMIYNIISLFSLLGVQGFVIPKNEKITAIINKLLLEEENQNIGKHKMEHTLTEQLVIEIFRHLETSPDFDKYREKLDYLLDKRLVSIIKYIHDNLERDLSNVIIAEVACVSEDYVGQFFKNLTNINLQEYIEAQRLEKAHFLLRTRSDIVQEIAKLVGFKDPAYFSRRFKLKYGVNANVIRRKDTFSI